MATKNVEIVLLKDADLENANALHNTLYNDNRSNAEFLWEFYKAPAGKAIYVIARDTDTQKVVGTQCAIPIELINDKGEVFLTAKSEDTLVDPEYRGLNIFENMYKLLFEECRKAGIKYLWGFTSAKKPFLKLGFQIPYDHSQSLMVIDIFSAYQYLSRLNTKNTKLSLFKIFGLCVMSKMSAAKRCFSANAKSISRYSLTVYDKSFSPSEAQYLRPDLNQGFAIRQDATFLKWRFVENPNHDKVVSVYFSDENKTVASIIFNYHEKGVWYLVNDAYAKGITLEQRKAMFSKAVKLLLKREKGGIQLIRTWDFVHNEMGRNEIDIRKGIGFTHLDRGISFVWKGLDEKDSLDVNAFYLSRIASQGVI